jgi:tRNA 2-thiouridine synthesizing protein E
MLDIGKYARDERLASRDPEGNMLDLEPWSPKKATQHAAKEGIALTEEHWAVIVSLRENFRKHGRSSSARELATQLEREFSNAGGRRHLYALFPGGPITQGCRIAGLPLPPYSTDPSFGSFW